MSDDPFSAYQSPDTPQQQPQPTSAGSRPASITVFGILNFVFAAWGLCGLCVGLFSLLGTRTMPNQGPNPVLEVMEGNQTYYGFTMVMMALGFVATGVLALAGYGLLKTQPWGRQLSIVYAVYTIIATIVTMIANWIWLTGPLMELADRAPPGPERAVAIFTAYMSVFGSCFSFIYPIILLIFMMRSNVVQAFRNQQGTNVPSY